MSIEDNWYVVRGLNNGKVEIDTDEHNGEIVINMSVYAAETEAKAVNFLRENRPNAHYGVTKYNKLKTLRNFRIQEDFAKGKNKGHYLISGITIAEAKNKFSQQGTL